MSVHIVAAASAAVLTCIQHRRRFRLFRRLKPPLRQECLISMRARRYIKSDAPVFVTQVTWNREPVFREAGHVALLMERLRCAKEKHSFRMVAYVVLPDHFHLLVTPVGETTVSSLLGWVKATFTIEYRQRHALPDGVMVWQKRFWDHVIRDEVDLNRHIDYIHHNPVRHGVATKPEAWPHSSFGWYRSNGYYGEGWGWSELPAYLEGKAIWPAGME